jgi:hypothetical protein
MEENCEALSNLGKHDLVLCLSPYSYGCIRSKLYGRGVKFTTKSLVSVKGLDKLTNWCGKFRTNFTIEA